MFAPPPVQLSRAQIEARLAAKARNAASPGSLGITTTTVSEPASVSLQRKDSRSPTSRSKHHVFSKGGNIKVSSPVAVYPQAPRLPPKKSSSAFKFTAGEEVDSPDLQRSFGEHPRRAPEPPKKGTRPPSGWFEQRLKGKSFPPQSPIPHIPGPSTAAPPIPAKSTRRQLQVFHHDATASDLPHVFDAASLNDVSWNLQIRESPPRQIEERPSQPRSLSTTSASAPQKTLFSSPSRHGRTFSDGVMTASGSGSAIDSVSTRAPRKIDGRVDKPTSKKSKAADPIREALVIYDELISSTADRTKDRRVTGDIDTTEQSTKQQSQLLWKQIKKGQTIGMLLESGLPHAESLTYNKLNTNADLGTPLPLPLSLANKDLPATPTSIVATPTEMYQVIPPKPSTLVIVNRDATIKKRSPLAPISTTHVKVNPVIQDTETVSPGRLSAIPEDSTISENSPAPSELSTPVETQIHLRNGSVVTVSPPEVTAWKRTLYIQGPIKLPKPVIVPRKDSIASLDAFQETIDQVYQGALVIPRRESEDAVVEDVCEFLDDFGFDEISYGGDILSFDKVEIDDVMEESIEVPERFSTPPAEQDPSPVEKVLAHEIVQVMSTPTPVAKPHIPPIQNAETLRAKGIARLAHGKTWHHPTEGAQNERKDSLTMSKADPAVLPLLPLPEESMLQAAIDPSRPESDNDVQMVDQPSDQSAFDWGDDVKELDGHTFLLGPRKWRNKGQRHKPPARPDTTPIERMRELAFL